MPGWIQFFVEMGLEQSEIDRILSRLNETYAKQKEQGSISPSEVYEVVEEKLGRTLTDEEKHKVRDLFGPEYKDALDKLRKGELDTDE